MSNLIWVMPQELASAGNNLACIVGEVGDINSFNGGDRWKDANDNLYIVVSGPKEPQLSNIQAESLVYPSHTEPGILNMEAAQDLATNAIIVGSECFMENYEFADYTGKLLMGVDILPISLFCNQAGIHLIVED